VKRNFLSELWEECQGGEGEELWKSSARQHLEAFELQLYSAVQSAQSSNSQLEWNVHSAVFNVWLVSSSLASNATVSTRTVLGRGLLVASALFGIPVYLALILTLARLISTTIKLIIITYLHSTDQEKTSCTKLSNPRHKKYLPQMVEGPVDEPLPLSISLPLLLAYLSLATVPLFMLQPHQLHQDQNSMQLVLGSFSELIANSSQTFQKLKILQLINSTFGGSILVIFIKSVKVKLEDLCEVLTKSLENSKDEVNIKS